MRQSQAREAAATGISRADETAIRITISIKDGVKHFQEAICFEAWQVGASALAILVRRCFQARARRAFEA